MDEQQIEKLATVLLDEAVVCAKRNDLENSQALMKKSVELRFNKVLDLIIKGDKKLLNRTVKMQFDKDDGKKAIARCMMHILCNNKEFIEKYKFILEAE